MVRALNCFKSPIFHAYSSLAEIQDGVRTSRTKRADLQQICNRSVLTKTDQLQTTLSSAESVFSLLQTLSLNTLRDVNTADAKQTNNRSTDYLQRLQMICNTLKPKCDIISVKL